MLLLNNTGPMKSSRVAIIRMATLFTSQRQVPGIKIKEAASMARRFRSLSNYCGLLSNFCSLS